MGTALDLEVPNTGESPPAPLPLPDAEVLFAPVFFNPAESDAYFEELKNNIQWEQGTNRLFGRAVDEPRLTAWYGDAGRSYTYSGITRHPHPWTPALEALRGKVERVTGVHFNSVLLNRYRGGRDSVDWHSDDEPELGKNPVIASVSFGATRRFLLRHKAQKEMKQVLELSHGSLQIMRGPTQHFWQHRVPKTAKPCGERINLTFRIIHGNHEG